MIGLLTHKALSPCFLRVYEHLGAMFPLIPLLLDIPRRVPCSTFWKQPQVLLPSLGCASACACGAACVSMRHFSRSVRAGAGGARRTQTAILGAQSGALHNLTVSFAAGGVAGASPDAALEYVSGFAATFDGGIYAAVCCSTPLLTGRWGFGQPKIEDGTLESVTPVCPAPSLPGPRRSSRPWENGHTRGWCSLVCDELPDLHVLSRNSSRRYRGAPEGEWCNAARN